MAQFCIEIAGRIAAVTSLFDSTRDYCRNYLTDKAPDYSVTVTREDLAFEQQALLEEALEEGIKPRVFTDPFLDRAAIQRKVAEALLDWDVLLFHGSTVAVDGFAYSFTADCGTGKSTHTRYWRQVFGERAAMVNDDKPFLKLTAEGVLACGAPWSGKHGLDTNVILPLKGICILRRGSENSIRSLSPEEAHAMLEKQSVAPVDPEKMPKFTSLVDKLSKAVPLWEMFCTKDPEAANVSHKAMSEGEIPCTENV